MTRMIVTDLHHIDLRIRTSPDLLKAIDFLRLRDLPGLPEGKVEIDGDRVYAMVQRYETKRNDAPNFECHRKYVDVQFIVTGEEVIGWAPRERMSITNAYDAVKDVCFGAVGRGDWTPLNLRAGQAAMLWPEDAHAPGLALAAGAPSRVMKIVVKVLV